MKKLFTIFLSFFTLLAIAQDIDNDGVPDPMDNCKYIYNPSQIDNDMDAIGDICDCSPSLSNPSETHKPAILIAANTGTLITSGTLVTFTTTTESAGSAPIYLWKKNNIVVGTSSPTYTDNTLTNGDQITCELTSDVVCAAGTTAISNVLTFSITTATHLLSYDTKVLVSIYPNPIKNQFNIHSNHSIKTIELFNPQGQLIKGFNESNSGVITIADIPSGLYILKVSHYNATISILKLIKE